MVTALQRIGLTDVGTIIKLMCLTAAGRIQPTDDPEDDRRHYHVTDSNRAVPTAFLNLPYDASTCTKLQHLGKVVEVLTNFNLDSATSVLEMCTRVYSFLITFFSWYDLWNLHCTIWIFAGTVKCCCGIYQS